MPVSAAHPFSPSRFPDPHCQELLILKLTPSILLAAKQVGCVLPLAVWLLFTWNFLFIAEVQVKRVGTFFLPPVTSATPSETSATDHDNRYLKIRKQWNPFQPVMIAYLLSPHILWTSAMMLHLQYFSGPILIVSQCPLILLDLLVLIILSRLGHIFSNCTHLEVSSDASSNVLSKSCHLICLLITFLFPKRFFVGWQLQGFYSPCIYFSPHWQTSRKTWKVHRLLQQKWWELTQNT